MLFLCFNFNFLALDLSALPLSLFEQGTESRRLVFTCKEE